MTARQAFVSASVIPALLSALVLPTRPAAQCTTGSNCGAAITGRGADHIASNTSAAEAVRAAPDAASKAQAAEIWESRCSACHGDEGRGDGPGAAALKPKPINFRKRDWQKSVPDAQIAKAIVGGGSAVGLSSQMPANPDLENEPAVVKALVAHVRELGQ